jgi:hypothetical protein
MRSLKELIGAMRSLERNWRSSLRISDTE